MSQRFGLYPDLSVIENIDFYADLYGVSGKGREARIHELLGFSQMRPFKRRKAGALSGGMKQKLQLVCRPDPHPGVCCSWTKPHQWCGPRSAAGISGGSSTISFREGVAILVTTAYLDEAERCDRIGPSEPRTSHGHWHRT